MSEQLDRIATALERIATALECTEVARVHGAGLITSKEAIAILQTLPGIDPKSRKDAAS